MKIHMFAAAPSRLRTQQGNKIFPSFVNRIRILRYTIEVRRFCRKVFPQTDDPSFPILRSTDFGLPLIK